MDTAPKTIEILNPMVDSVFKRIFGENEHIFIDFVNSIFIENGE
ncbi:MAG: Rpn family recombination-promoting nuclease/putative transposase [Silvanigrellaceae bacterium]|nr:Rpn family recombination-promoting nuclease/putative transposase [Silvanigrellaceae bacterium]